MASRRLWGCLLPLVSIVLVTVSALNNGLGITPPMGWNTWYEFAPSMLNRSLNFPKVYSGMVRQGLLLGRGNTRTIASLPALL